MEEFMGGIVLGMTLGISMVGSTVLKGKDLVDENIRIKCERILSSKQKCVYIAVPEK